MMSHGGDDVPVAEGEITFGDRQRAAALEMHDAGLDRVHRGAVGRRDVDPEMERPRRARDTRVVEVAAHRVRPVKRCQRPRVQGIKTTRLPAPFRIAPESGAEGRARAGCLTVCAGSGLSSGRPLAGTGARACPQLLPDPVVPLLPPQPLGEERLDHPVARPRRCGRRAPFSSAPRATSGGWAWPAARGASGSRRSRCRGVGSSASASISRRWGRGRVVPELREVVVLGAKDAGRAHRRPRRGRLAAGATSSQVK